MIAEVVIPSIRNAGLSRLLYSLGQQTRKPDLVTIVSNEVSGISRHGLSVRILRFDSDEYPYGKLDVALRRNVGIWESKADVIIFQDDDQLAPPNMVEKTMEKIELEPFVWGHHRFIDFDTDTDEILRMGPEAGRTREHPPNAFHQFHSCYAGMMAARRDLLLELQGFDLLFLGRHGSEDQSLGQRMLQHFGMERVFIHEPPFAWHPLGSPRSHVEAKTNLCAEHQMEYVTTNGVLFQTCSRCPYRACVDKSEVYFSGAVVLPYDHSLVRVKKENI